MATGSIKRLISDRGFGFIVGDDAKEYFFHRDAVEQPVTFESLQAGEKVEFDVTSGPKGPRAVRVRRAS
ncbi:MAG TPA: cold shock domain-containing protein [Candidatus Limnocylindrales bacterium]|jgi:CspA family cold shock protein|nr:cold shock domain-containing protein [Candidatus Limnocylindrales bacterium]